jgi:transcriptional regulator GlxA family with amidase domain
VDDRIISCTGPAQAVDVALLLLRTLVGDEVEAAVRRFLCQAQ